MQINKGAYRDYLMKKNKKQTLINEYMSLLDSLAAVLNDNPATTDIIPDFNRRTQSWSRVALNTAYQFLDDYTKFIQKEQPLLAEAIRMGCRQIFEQTAKEDVKNRKQDILSIPANAKIDPKHLIELTNEQFVAAFDALQQFIIACYTDIEKEPFAWGYPDFYITEGYYNRVMDILFEFVFNGSYCDGVLTVDTKKFFVGKGVKRHKKVELMIAGFENFGFLFDGFNKKSESFRVSFSDNPHVITVLNAYANEIDTTIPDWAWGKPRHSLSYRYIEDPSAQQYESVFLAEMDYASDEFREIQYWLHDEAAKYGFCLDPKSPKSLQFKKGSKEFFFVAEKVPKGLYGGKGIYAKVSFLKAFENEPDKMKSFCERFPHVFRLEDKGKCCNENKCMFRMRFTFEGVSYLRCGLKNFIFDDIDLDDIKAILEMFVIENKLKRCAV